MFLDELARVLRLNVPADQKIKLAQAETQKIILGEEELERQRIIDLRTRFRGGAEKEEANISWFSDEETIDLGIVRHNKLIWNRPFKALYITECKIVLPGGNSPVAYLRFNNIASSKYKVKTGFVKGNFSKLYLTNTVQTNCRFKFVIAQSEEAEFRMLGETASIVEEINALQGLTTERTLADLFDQLTEIQRRATTPTLYNIDLTDADTEYSQALPVACKQFSVVLADLATFRLAFAAGKVAAPTAPYYTQVANKPFERQGLYLSGKTIYLATPVATKVGQILCWV